MAVESPHSSCTDEEDVSVAELVFSCCICQATTTDVYATAESNHGFHSGSSGEDGIVTKMYISSCAHVTCSKHLQNGGAVPFHPENQQPRAACPKCVKDKGDDSLKDLFAIHGLSEGQYDSTIPEMWVHCPAIKLDDSIEGMDAVRFQYMALCHYGREVRKHWNIAMQKGYSAEAALTEERQIRKRLQSEQTVLQEKVETLQKMEAQVRKWEDRTPVISHYMNAFTEMTKDNERMRSQLIELGFDVPVRKYLYEGSKQCKSDQPQLESRPTGLQHAAIASIGIDHAHATHEDNSSSARKRKHDELLNSTQRGDRQPSRDLMPPPLPTIKSLQHTSRITRELSIRPPAITRAQPLQSPGSHKSNAPSRTRREPRIGQYYDANVRYDHVASLPQDTAMLNDLSELQREPEPVRREPELPRHFLPPGYTHERVPDSKQYDPVSLAQLSLQSAGYELDRRSEDFLKENGAQSDYRFHPFLSESALSGPYQGAEKTFASQNHDYRGRLPLKLAGQFYEHPPALGSSRVRGVVPTHPPDDLYQSQSRYADSPFFKRHAGDSRSNIMLRPSTRRSDIQDPFQTHGNDHRIAAPNMVGRQTFVQNSAAIYDLNDHESRHRSLQSQIRPVTNRHQGTEIPHTSRNCQGSFGRTANHATPVFRSSPKRDPRDQNRRITLAPSSATTALLPMDQDAVLSQIRGVRGVSSYKQAAVYHQSSTNYGLARQLFSAGQRQSIRR